MKDSVEARLTKIEARLTRLEQRPPPRKRGRHIDPKFPRILRQSLQEKGLSQSDLAALMWGRRINSAGKNDAIGKDRISVWANGHNYPSDEHMALLAHFVDIV
jgi:hypothetical protein